MGLTKAERKNRELEQKLSLAQANVDRLYKENKELSEETEKSKNDLINELKNSKRFTEGLVLHLVSKPVKFKEKDKHGFDTERETHGIAEGIDLSGSKVEFHRRRDPFHPGGM